MRQLVIAALLLGALDALPAAAQQLDETQMLGRQLLNQHCAICHLRPQLGAATFGPMLSKETLGGQDVALRDFISNGTAKMPGFKYEFKPEQLNAIIAYIKTVPAPAPAVTPVKQ